jgi:hypothetical protein
MRCAAVLFYEGFMETGGQLRLADVFVSIRDPRQKGKVEHNLAELLVVAVNAVLVAADTFVEIELWAKEKLDWLRGYIPLAKGIPSHDTFGRLFGLIDAQEFEAAFRRWGWRWWPSTARPAAVRVRSMARPYIWSPPLPPELDWYWDSGPRPRSPMRRRPSPNCWPPLPCKAAP